MNSVSRSLLILVMFGYCVVGLAAEPKASRTTFLKLMDVQELWEEDKFDQAIVELEALVAANVDKPFDFALANQYLAHTSVMMGEPERARPALEAALRMPGLSVKLGSELKLFYGQIVLGDEEFDLAKRMFDEWLATTDAKPTPVQLFSVSYANYRSGHLEPSAQFIKRAVDLRPNPPDSWRRLQYQILFELERYGEALDVVYLLLNRNPQSEEFWRLLSSHHMRLEDHRKSLAAFSIAEQQGLIEKESDLRNVASLYGHVSIPEKAARLLQQWIAESRIEADSQTYRQLGDLWMLARERDNAKAALWNAVEGDPSADVYEFLAGIHFEDAEWERAYTAFEKVLETGDVEADDRPRIELLAGLTAMRAGYTARAREHLLLAQKSDKLRSQVRSLLRDLDES